MDEAVTPFPMPERTPPVTTTILRSEANVEATSSESLGGRLFSLVLSLIGRERKADERGRGARKGWVGAKRREMTKTSRGRHDG